MKRTGRFAPSDSERQQLEEISHLYFSTPAASRKKSDPGHPAETPARTLDPHARPFFVYCTAGRNRSFLTAGFLYNLSLLLQVASDRVLLLCSRDTYRNRFSFAFRPDRERAVRIGRNPVPTGVLGPLGICLLDARSIDGSGRIGAHVHAKPPLSDVVPFHYLLADKPCSGLFPQALPDLTLFLVTPETPHDAFSEHGGRGGTVNLPGPAHAGIVTAGVAGSQEALRLYSRWKAQCETLYPDRYRLESYGTIPGWEGGGSSSFGSAMGVLENPTSRQTRCYLETASLVRKKRMEMRGAYAPDGNRSPAQKGGQEQGKKEAHVPEPFRPAPVLVPRTSRDKGISTETLFHALVKSRFFRAAGLAPVSHDSFGKDPRYPRFLLRDSCGRLMLLEFFLKPFEQEPDSLLSRYRFLRKHLPWIVEFMKASSPSSAGLTSETPGVVLVMDDALGSRGGEPELPTGVPVVAYRLRYQERSEGLEVMLEPA